MPIYKPIMLYKKVYIFFEKNDNFKFSTRFNNNNLYC